MDHVVWNLISNKQHTIYLQNLTALHEPKYKTLKYFDLLQYITSKNFQPPDFYTYTIDKIIPVLITHTMTSNSLINFHCFSLWSNNFQRYYDL